jgi:hypothetical protein
MKRIKFYQGIFILSSLLFIASFSAAQNAWINEIHYDNASTDADEAVEIVIENALSYTLSDFQFILYNGY